jgi:hypothetical protein
MDTTDIIKQLTAERDRIDAVIKLLSGPPHGSTSQIRKRWKMSAAARKRIGEAQRKRWAAQNTGKTTPVKAAKKAAPDKKRRLSAAARKRIAAGQKKRWAVIKTGKTAEKAAPAKKVAKKAPAKKAVAAKKAAPKKAPAAKVKIAVPEKAATVSTEAATS